MQKNFINVDKIITSCVACVTSCLYMLYFNGYVIKILMLIAFLLKMTIDNDIHNKIGSDTSVSPFYNAFYKILDDITLRHGVITS